MTLDSKQSEEFDKEMLLQVTETTGNLLAQFIAYIQQEFNTSQTKATFVAGILISSLPSMIKENENGVYEVQKIIKDFEEIRGV